MISRIFMIAALAAATPAEAGFWGDLKRSFGTAVDNAQHDGAKAIDAITGDGGNAAADPGTGASAGAPETATAPAARPLDGPAEQPLDGPADPVSDGSKQLSKQPWK